MRGVPGGLIILSNEGNVRLASGTARGVLGCCPPEDLEPHLAALLDPRPRVAARESPEAAAVLLGTAGATEGSRNRRHAAHRFLGHALRGVLNTVALHLGLVREAVQEPDKGSEWGARIERYVEVLSRQQVELRLALDDLLEASTPPGGERSLFDLREACRNAARLSRWSARDAVEPTLELPAAPVHVRDDRDAVRQTILEALLFALDAGDEGVHLRLASDAGHARVLVVAGSAGSGPSPPETVSRTACLRWPVAGADEVA